MRPILALLITVVLFTGVYAYTSFVESVRKPPLEIKETFSNDAFSIRVSRTMNCQSDSDYDRPALVVRFRGQTIFESQESVLPASQPIVIPALENVVQSANEIYFAAHLETPNNGWGAKPNGVLAGDFSDDWGDDSAEKSTEDTAKGADEEASPANNSVPAAVRIQVFRGDERVADRTFWQTSRGKMLQGSLSFTAPGETEPEHEHEP